MREIQPSTRAYLAEGVLFHIASLSEGLRGGPSGVWIETEFVKENPVLRTVVRNGTHYKFIAQNPLWCATETSLKATLLKLTQRSVPGEVALGTSAKVDLYAEVVDDLDAVRAMLEAAAGSSPDPPEVIRLVESLAKTGYELTCEFINVLRRSHNQYWITHPHLGSWLGWGTICYYSHPRDKWYAIGLEPDFWSDFMKPDLTGGPAQGPILLGMITSTNVDRIQAESADADYSFADEMVSSALVELGESRVRSAIVHGVIALESSSKRVLERLIECKLAGFEKGGTIEAISKELSVVALARLVLSQIAGEKVAQEVDWVAIQQLYDTRNTIVHKSRKRLPDIESVKQQLLEVMKYVNRLESNLASLAE
jgi:hypothetical protein